MTESMQSQAKFLVVSYDDDQHQWFYDFVVAQTEEEAEQKVCALRTYILAADAVTVSELKGFAETLESETFDEVQAAWKRWRKDHNNDGNQIC
jgi:hypothetical protein